MLPQTIFIAYAHKDKKWLDMLDIHLRGLKWSKNIEVWSDKDIKGGQDWFERIVQSISRASIAILIVSADFLASEFIGREEMPRLFQRHQSGELIVIPVLARHCVWEESPWLSKIQIRPGEGIALADFSPSSSKCEKALVKITKEVSKYLNAETVGDESSTIPQKTTVTLPTALPLAQARALPTDFLFSKPRKFPIGGLPSPCFFPSISSAAKSTLSPLDHLRILVKFEYPCFLASVYDFAQESRKERLQMTDLLAQAVKKGQVVLLDSGLYEDKWSRGTKWSKPDFFKTIKSVPCHFGFYYDDVKPVYHDDVKPEIVNIKETAIKIAKWVKNDRRKAEVENLFPIIHVEGKLLLEELCPEVVSVLDPEIIAVTERELGDGILQGVKKMVAIRKAVNAVKENVYIHLLGTGNPLSLLIYSACGVDSFDGLDWCQTIVDYEGKRLYHNQQLDFFLNQSDYARADGLGYSTRMLAHNLAFYKLWMKEIRTHKENGTLPDLLKLVLPQKFFGELLTLLS